MRSLVTLVTVTTLSVILFTGCGYRYAASGISVTSMDLSESAVLTTDFEEANGTRFPRACVTPSPDAAAALSMALSLDGNLSDKATIGLATSLQQGESFVGLRTHSIQLLRDMTYRACEAYLSGAIEGSEYAHLLRRFQKNMVTLMSIEQLTGVVKTAPVIVDLSSETNMLDTILKDQERIDAIDEKINDFKKTIAELDTKISKLEPTEEVKKEAATEQAKEDDTKTSKQEATEEVKKDDKKSNTDDKLKAYKAEKEFYTNKVKDYEEIKELAAASKDEKKSKIAKGDIKTRVVDINITSNIKQSDAATIEIIKAVKELTLKMVEADDAPNLCFDYLSKKSLKSNTGKQAAGTKKQAAGTKKQAAGTKKQAAGTKKDVLEEYCEAVFRGYYIPSEEETKRILSLSTTMKQNGDDSETEVKEDVKIPNRGFVTPSSMKVFKPRGVFK